MAAPTPISPTSLSRRPMARILDLPDVSYQGNGPVSLPVPEGLTADSYTIRAKVTYYEGMWGVRIASGDVNGKNYNGTSLGRGFSVQVVREGTGYALAGTETSMDAVRPGTTWDVRIEIGDRGEQMRLYIDGALVADGHETPDEPRRTVTVSRDSSGWLVTDLLRVDETRCLNP